MIEHKERAHSKYSASGAERWHNCSASVSLEEKSPPSPDNEWSLEGTFAHELLERLLRRQPYSELSANKYFSSTMYDHVARTADKVRAIHKVYGGKLLIEKRVYATFLHEEMFGTCDVIIASDDGTLHIIDFKYGQGHIVDPEENYQLLQYAISAAESYNWDFVRVKMWILQPRAGANWHKSWVISMKELKDKWVPIWQDAVKRVELNEERPQPGSWCHWCRAKNICPAKREQRAEKIINVFEQSPLTKEESNGIEKESKVKSPKGRKESKKENPFIGDEEKESSQKEESQEKDFY